MPDQTAITTALDYLRKLTRVDCDTLDSAVAKLYGPFEDCTSNQAIAYTELKTGKHEVFLQKAARHAAALHHSYPGLKMEALAAELATILLSLEMVPCLHGFNHIQVNTFDSESVDQIVQSGTRIKALCKELDPAYDASRLCIKIPSTWEGLQACRVLERDHGIRTLATTLFGFVQAHVAAEVGCRYIAPYVHTLPDVMGLASPDSPDQIARMMHVAASVQSYYLAQGLTTQVLPAALMTLDECIALSGVHHITLSPARLQELDASQAPASSAGLSVITKAQGLQSKTDLEQAKQRAQALAQDEALFRSALAEEADGVPLASMTNAIAIFNTMQSNLEMLLKPYCERALLQ